jgi:hypothetical protein
MGGGDALIIFGGTLSKRLVISVAVTQNLGQTFLYYFEFSD